MKAGILGVAALCAAAMTGCAPEADSGAALAEFSECCAAGNWDGAAAALSRLPGDAESSAAAIRAAGVAARFGHTEAWSAEKAEEGVKLVSAMLSGRGLSPVAANVLRVRAFAACLRLGKASEAMLFLRGCTPSAEVSADALGEFEAHLRRTGAAKALDDAGAAAAEQMLASGALDAAACDSLRGRLLPRALAKGGIGEGLALLSKCGKSAQMRSAAYRAFGAHVRGLPPEGVVEALSKMAAAEWFRPADYVAQLTEDMFIRFSGDGASKPSDAKRLGELLKFSGGLLDAKGLLSEAAADSLGKRRLDGFFLTGDYDGAVAFLEGGGACGATPLWRKGTAAKLRAHKAMEAGDAKEAVKQLLVFGEFMESDEQKDFEDCDPVTGVAYSREWVLARNHVRCAEMLKKAGDAAGAAAHLEKAKARFAEAEKKAAADKKSLAALKDEMGKSGFASGAK